jgi:phosphoribosylaminoimidazole-succinocarboxamide synthase
MLAADRFVRSGKVRDLYALDAERLLLVASDRLSAFDVVLPTAIPDKGLVLTALSRFWFAETAAIIPNHLLGTDPDDAATIGPADALRGRSMVCRRANVVPVEAVVRGYLAGSGWKEYRETGTVCGVALPQGLRESDRLPDPIFTPATKEEGGAHDVNISFDDMVDHLSAVTWLPAAAAGPVAEAIRDHALRLYRYGSAVAARAGILLADTKFEFGFVPDDAGDGSRADTLTLVDEALTPDSSRFWDAVAYEPGRTQASYDKQFVRDWLEAHDWDKRPPGPELPEDVVAGTRARYVEAYERITGASFARYLEEDVIAR